MDEQWKIGENIVVVGGGNVAFDVARTSVRNGAKKVTMVCLESPAMNKQLMNLRSKMAWKKGSPSSIASLPLQSNAMPRARSLDLRVQQIYSLFDHTGRFAPQIIPDSQYVIPCDTIALAIGQAMDMSFFNGWDKKDQLNFDRGVIKTERGTGRTSCKRDLCRRRCCFWSRPIHHGDTPWQEAARAIDRICAERNPIREFVGEFTEISPMRDKTYLRTKWALPTMQPPEVRIHNKNMVENNYTDEEAHAQSNRCLQCHVSPVFDGDLCIKCNGCVDVCPCNCLKLVPISKLNLDLGEGICAEL